MASPLNLPARADFPEVDVSIIPARHTMNGKPAMEIEAKTILNFESAFGEKLLCDGMTFSLGTACAYSCAFCYVEAAVRKHPGWSASWSTSEKKGANSATS